MSLNYSGTVTIENLQDYSEMMNSAEYIDWRRWSYYYLNPSKYPRGDQPTKENDYEIFLGATDPTAWKWVGPVVLGTVLVFLIRIGVIWLRKQELLMNTH